MTTQQHDCACADCIGVDCKCGCRETAAAASSGRRCGFGEGQRCDCAPRLRIFDPMGRGLLLTPVYY